MSASQAYSPTSPTRRRGRAPSSTRVTWSETISTPNRSACRRIRSMRSGPSSPCGVAWPVVDFGRRHELPAWLQSRDQQRLSVRARRIHRGRIAGRPGAEDDEARMARGGHVYSGVRATGAFRARGQPSMGACRSICNALIIKRLCSFSYQVSESWPNPPPTRSAVTPSSIPCSRAHCARRSSGCSQRSRSCFSSPLRASIRRTAATATPASRARSAT